MALVVGRFPIRKENHFLMRSSDRPHGRPGPWFVLTLAFTIVSFTNHARAATIHVPADQPTLQAAVAAASSGDQILLAPGTHQGGVYVTGKSLTFASWYTLTGDTTYIAQTVLSGSLPGYCGPNTGCTGDATLEFHTSADNSAVIGLTLTGTFKGVRTSAIVNVQHCRLVGLWDGVNYESDAGGVVSDCYIANNADDGIDFQDRVELVVERNVIRDNADDGIELRMYPYTGAARNIHIRDNLLIHNDEDAIQIIDSPDSSHRVIWIERNLFTSHRMAAIGVMGNQQTLEDLSGSPSHERVHLFHNTFVNENYGMVGGVNVVTVNNLFSGITNAALRKATGASEASYNLFHDVGAIADTANYDPAHSLTSDPQLDPWFRPAMGSPAIDAGTAEYVFQGQTVLSEAAFLGAAPDLGLDEFNSNAPLAVADVLTADEGAATTVNAPGVLSNDIDSNLDPLTVTQIVTPPSHGLVAIDANGSYTYTHDGSETTSDSFVYEITDPTNYQSQATVTITVTPTNDAPVALRDDTLVDMSSSGNPIDVLRNDTDPDAGDTFSLLSLDLSQTLGSATIQGAKVSYTPPAGWTGYDLLHYTMQDAAGAPATALLSIRVEDVVPGALNQRVSASADDAEQSANGSVSITSSDLELTFDGNTQTVGLRWPNLPVPAGSVISSAYVQLTAKEIHSEPTALTIRGQASDSAVAFAAVLNDVTSRPQTTAAASWSPGPWTAVDQSGPAQITTDLSAVIQEIVDRPGWKVGNALALIVSGTGHRTAYSQNASSNRAALLHIDYYANVPPIPLAVGDGAASGVDLLRAYPNPTRGLLSLEFALAGSGAATMELIDVAGRRVVKWPVGEMGPGRHTLALKQRLPIGVYLARLTEGPRVRTAKIAVIE
jgi:VCBS repeat-containing protein